MGNSDSKSKFRESVYKLSNEQVSGTNIEFWNKLWNISTTAEEIFTLIQPDDVRMLRKNQPANLATMYEQAVVQLTQIVDTPLPKYFSQALNCVRVLTRLTPFILEDTSDDWIEKVLWSVSKEDTEYQHPLGQRLMEAVMGLLFLPDFTISSQAFQAYRQQVQESTRSGNQRANVVYPSLLWLPGVGYPDATTQSNTTFDKNRKEVLKLLITCFSGILYTTPDTYDQNGDKFLQVATSSACELGPTLFHSLLNVVISYDPVGWGVPYAGSVLTDERETLVDASVQTLLVLLDFGTPLGTNPPVPPTEEKKTEDSPRVLANEHVNNYRVLLSTIQRREDFELIYQGISRLLNNYHQAINTYLPNSIKQIQCHQELLVLFWKLLDENKEFLAFITRKKDTWNLLVPILFFMHEGRKEPSKVGMIHICTFILLLLSGERDFCVNLNHPFTQKLPTDLPLFSGNHADLIIIVLHKVIVNGFEKLNSVYNCFLTIISNLSPYCKKLNMTSSVRIVRLFKLFSQPRYLYDNEANHHLIFFLLDTFNNIIQYQYEGNPHLVYSIVQSKDLFYKLNSLPVPTVNTPTSTTTSSEATDSNQEKSFRTAPSTSSVEDSEPDVAEPATPGRTEPKIKHEEAMLPGPVDENRFVATPEWVKSWKKKLPLTTTLRLLQYLLPQLEDACEKAGGSLDENAMLKFLKTTTMVGLLPVPHPIVIRKYQPNQFTNLWFTTFAWGIIFLRNQTLPIFDGKTITLFTINVLD